MVAGALKKSLQEFIDQLGVACGGVPDQDLLEATQLGQSISMSIPRIGEHELVSLGHDFGGSVAIDLQGNEQPEAARIMEGILTSVLRRLHEPDAEKHQTQGDGTGRSVRFHIPTRKTQQFCDALGEISLLLKQSPQLKEQCHRGLKFAAETLNPIEEIRTTIHLSLPNGKERDGTAPHFDLHVAGLPEKTAREVLEIQGFDEDYLRESKPRRSRDLKKTFTEGYDAVIPLDSNTADEALQAIAGYAQSQHQAIAHEEPGKIPEPRKIPGYNRIRRLLEGPPDRTLKPLTDSSSWER